MTKAELQKKVERLEAQVEILLKLAKEQGVRVEYVPYYPWYMPYYPRQPYEPWRITWGDSTANISITTPGPSTEEPYDYGTAYIPSVFSSADVDTDYLYVDNSDGLRWSFTEGEK